MSLNRQEMARTAEEMAQHLELSGLSVEDLARWVGMSTAQVRGVVAMDGTGSPSDTWLIRDCLDLAARERGADGGAWTILTDQARGAARQWFVLQDVPPRPSSLT